jgi:formate hydrogenlyase transcriptional activator
MVPAVSPLRPHESAILTIETDVAATTNRSTFDRIVADIAVGFATSSLDAIDNLIGSSLRQIGEALQLDRVILWQKSADDVAALATHFWTPLPESACPAPLHLASVPFVAQRLKAGESVRFTSTEQVPDAIDRETLLRFGVQSGMIVPLAPSGSVEQAQSALMFGWMNSVEWPTSIAESLRSVAGVISLGLTCQSTHVMMRKALDEIEHLRGRRADVAVKPRREVTSRISRISRPIESESPAIKRALAQMNQVAGTSATVLLCGATGTGKEVFAQAIHDLSPRSQRSMVAVNCAAIPTALIESELFGHERGAYTDALSRQIGRFEAANRSTLFLDEIGELPAEMQVKLLRVLQARVIERLGSTQPVKIDIRIIAATNRNLEAAVLAGTFREDLYYRLNVFPIWIPPLRERVEDILGLVWAFIDEFAPAFGKQIDSVSEESLQKLKRYPWPGNIRELRNVIERAVILSTDRQLVVPLPPEPWPSKESHTLESLSVDHICKVLDSTNWRIRGAGGAAERLGVKPTTLESRMARLGIGRTRDS